MTPDYNYPLPLVPLVPADILRQHFVFEPQDARFRSAARLLQALWREDRELPIGHYRGADGKRLKLGSRITPAAGRAGENFMAPAVTSLVRRECAYREIGSMIDEWRLFTNLLSSMPLTFNLFGLLKIDLALASRFLAEMFPELRGADVRGVLFEHSPGRGDPAWTADYTAFDAAIVYQTPAGRRGFVGIEVKYSESCQEPAASMRPRYDELALASGVFIEPMDPALRANPLQQLFRGHLLTAAMLLNGAVDEARFVLVAPQLNKPVVDAAAAYTRTLSKELSAERAGFAYVTLEDAIAALALAGEEDYAAQLHRRYADFWLVDGALNLHWAGDGPLKTTVAPGGPIKVLPGGRA